MICNFIPNEDCAWVKKYALLCFFSDSACYNAFPRVDKTFSDAEAMMSPRIFDCLINKIFPISFRKFNKNFLAEKKIRQRHF